MNDHRNLSSLNLVSICRENPRRSGIPLFPDRPRFCRDIGKFESELELKDTTMASNEVCYLDTRIKQGDDSTHISAYQLSISACTTREMTSDFRIVNFPHMDSNIPANPAYGIYISQLVRYARICTSKADFLHRLRQVSSRLHRQGFKSAFLLRSLTKFFNRHGGTFRYEYEFQTLASSRCLPADKETLETRLVRQAII